MIIMQDLPKCEQDSIDSKLAHDAPALQHRVVTPTATAKDGSPRISQPLPPFPLDYDKM